MTWRGALSYVTGSHNMKFGYGAGLLRNTTTTQVGSQISYRFNNTIPNLVTQRIGPSRTSNSVRYDAIYAQDQWTKGRLTLQGGVRYEYAYSWAPAGDNGILEDNQFSSALLFPRTKGVRGFHDITPRRKRVRAMVMSTEAQIAFALMRGGSIETQKSMRCIMAFHLPRRMGLR